MKIKLITLKEYEMTSPGDLNSKDILEIEKLNKLSKTKIFELLVKNTIKAKQFVGIVKVNNKNIQILPKIFDEKENKGKQEENNHTIKNLLYMLSYTKKLNIKEADIANLGKINNLFEIFIYIFTKELLELLKKDFKKNYNVIKENSSFLKGKLLFSKHIKINLFNKSKFFVEYERMDENILLNIFLKSVVRKLLKITQLKQNYKLLKKCDFILKDIDEIFFKAPNILNKLNFNRQNIEYKNIFSLGKMLYFGNSPDFSENFENNFSILFDMNLLFEEFISEFIKKNKKKINNNIVKVNSQVSNRYIFENNKFKLKPDLILDFERNERIIIDTKYKKLINNPNKDFGVKSSDIYQMIMYGLRYFKDITLNLNNKNIILLYPEYSNEQICSKYNNKQEEINIHIKTINLKMNLSNKEGQINLITKLKEILYIS